MAPSASTLSFKTSVPVVLLYCLLYVINNIHICIRSLSLYIYIYIYINQYLSLSIYICIYYAISTLIFTIITFTFYIVSLTIYIHINSSLSLSLYLYIYIYIYSTKLNNQFSSASRAHPAGRAHTCLRATYLSASHSPGWALDSRSYAYLYNHSSMST